MGASHNTKLRRSGCRRSLRPDHVCRRFQYRVRYRSRVAHPCPRCHSMKQRWVHWRWSCLKFLRQTFQRMALPLGGVLAIGTRFTTTNSEVAPTNQNDRNRRGKPASAVNLREVSTGERRENRRKRREAEPGTPDVARLYWAGECRNRRKYPLSAKFPAREPST